MYKTTAAVVTTALLASGAFAQEVQTSSPAGVYVGVGMALEAVPDNADNGLGLVLKGGTKLDSVLKNLGAEVELTASLIDPEYGRNNDVDIMTLAGYMTYDIEFPNSDVFVRPRFGVIIPNLGDDESVNSRNIGLSTGVMLGFEVSKNVNLYVDYTNLGEHVNDYGFGAEFSF